MSRVLKGVISLLGAAVMLAVSATSALAADAYTNGVAGESTGGGGTLPFTGVDLALYAVIGVGIVGSGLALRGYSSRRIR